MAGRQLFSTTVNTGVGVYAAECETSSHAQYAVFQFEGATTANIEVYGKLHEDATWALLDTVAIIANTPVVKTYFNANVWAFRVSSIGAALAVKGFAQNVL